MIGVNGCALSVHQDILKVRIIVHYSFVFAPFVLDPERDIVIMMN